MRASKQPQIRGIIRLMRRTLDIYHFVKTTQNVIDDVDNAVGGKITHQRDTMDLLMRPAASEVKNKFTKTYKMKFFKVNAICKDAIDSGYLKENSNYDPGEDKLIPSLEMTSKGHGMLDTIPFLPFLPYGLLKSWWEEDRLAIKLLLVAIVAFAGYLFGGTVITILKGIINL